MDNTKNSKSCKSASNNAKNVKQDNNNKKTDMCGNNCKNTKMANDTAIRGNKSARNERDDLSGM